MIIRTTTDVGILIREARTRKGMTQADLSRLTHTTIKWISHIENGKPTAEIGLVLQALTALGVTMDFQFPPATADRQPGTDRDDDEIPYKL